MHTATLPATREAAFLAAICENPDDVTLRLIYADWLEERGDPRGEFIRVQRELEVLDKRLHDLSQPEQDGDYDRWSELRTREQELLEAHGRAWWPLPNVPFGAV